MNNSSRQGTLKYPEFWKRLEESARRADRIPDWIRGSPVNLREANDSAEHAKASESDDAESCKVSGSGSES